MLYHCLAGQRKNADAFSAKHVWPPLHTWRGWKLLRFEYSRASDARIQFLQAHTPGRKYTSSHVAHFLLTDRLSHHPLTARFLWPGRVQILDSVRTISQLNLPVSPNELNTYMWVSMSLT